MTQAVRSFLAFEIPRQIKDALTAGREALRAELPRARWVRPEGQHITLKFFGEVRLPLLDGLVEALTPRLARLPKVTVELAGGGFFPSASRPRVAWVGGEAAGVGPVVEAIEEVAEGFRLPRERRPWSLHLTQARLDRPWPPPAIARYLAWGDGLRLEPFTAGEVVLFSSSLQPGGAVYTALERMPLA